MKLAFAAVALSISSTLAGVAAAQPLEAERPAAGRVPAPSDALEIGVATGYTQGFGNLKSGTGFPSVATPGLGLDLSIGYRLDPQWAFLVAGQYQELTSERAKWARGITATVAVQRHFKPTSQQDPWLELGTGYRVLWEVPTAGPTITNQGLELARVRAGLDFRVDKNVALGPVLGADLNLFLFQDTPNLATNISEPRLSMFVYGGLQGRFDIGAAPEGRPVATR